MPPLTPPPKSKAVLGHFHSRVRWAGVAVGAGTHHPMVCGAKGVATVSSGEGVPLWVACLGLQAGAGSPQGQAGSDAVEAPVAGDPVTIPKPGRSLCAARAVAGLGQAPSPSPPGLEPGQSPPLLGWEKPLNQGHLLGDWRLGAT